MPLNKVLIVGAGPSGLLLALLLAKAGVPVELLEMAHALDTRPRASHYSEPSCHEFERAGVLDAIRAEGFFPNGVSWRKLDEAKTRIVKLKTYEDHHDAHAAAEGGGGGGGGGGAGGADPDEAERYRMVCLPLHRLGRILEAAVREQPAAVIRYGHKVVDVGEDEANGRAWVKVEVRADGDDGPEAERETETETKTKTLTFTADYVVGCDGATSRVRQALFGRDVFPGYTWKEQIVATDMYYDFAPYDYDDSQFFVHDEHWHMVAKIQRDGLHRVTYGEKSGLSTEELRARLPHKYKAFLPGHPDPPQYRVVNFSPYKVHQRCVDRMRVGRFLLAADAAHLCNPFGGLGLTGGIADVGSLYDSLVGIHRGLADGSILDQYDEQRRRIWHEVINPISTENLRRLFTLDPDTAADVDPFFRMLKQADADPELKSRLKQGMMALRHDMTQYYNHKTGQEEAAVSAA